jgi:hypothetical protein
MVRVTRSMPKDNSCHDNWQWCAAREWRAEAPRQALRRKITDRGLLIYQSAAAGGRRRGENLVVSPGIFTALTDTWFRIASD